MTELVLKTINEELAQLTEQGAQYFEPYRFAYIESMVRRSSIKSPTIILLLLDKIQCALTEYQVDFEAAQDQASNVLDKIKLQFPNNFEVANGLYEQAHFSALAKHFADLELNNLPSEIATLTKLISNSKAASDESPENTNFSDLLYQQGGSSNESRNELKTIRRLRESWEQYNAEQVVAQGIKEGPENPGPINPHMLAIRSLTAMSELSPHYLKRFIAYVDTLFWLEGSGKNSK